MGIARMNGGGGDKIVELEGLTVYENFEAVWAKSKIEKEKVISLSKEGLSRNAIALRMGYARSTVSRVLNLV